MGELWKFLLSPSWGALSKSIGCDHVKERPSRLNPSRKHAEDHDIVALHDMMGLSCWVFALPSIVYLMYCGSTNAGCASVGLALGMNMFLVYVSSVSFLADYWYTGDTPASEEHGVPECQKQWIF